jgi:hypothetical protein
MHGNIELSGNFTQAAEKSLALRSKFARTIIDNLAWLLQQAPPRNPSAAEHLLPFRFAIASATPLGLPLLPPNVR